MQETFPREITSKILIDYGPKLREISTFHRDSGLDCDEEYIRTQSKVNLTLKDLFMVAGETQKPVGIYVDGPTHELQISYQAYERMSMYDTDPWNIPEGAGFFMILDPTNLSVVTLSINSIRSNYGRGSTVSLLSNYKYQTFLSIEKAYNYMEDELYYLNTAEYDSDEYNSDEGIEPGQFDDAEDPYYNRKLKEYLADPISRFYVVSQRFSGCENYRPYFNSYVEKPRLTHTYGLYYSMILILLGRKNIERLKTSNPDVLKKYLEEDRKEVLDMIRVEKAAVSALTLSRYLEEEELAKRIGGMTMNL